MESAVQFYNNGKKLYGILNLPDNTSEPETILLLVIGGPQTRVGSHRLYTKLARFLENQGVASFRFDYEGNGDSEGNWIGYRYAGDSIEAAINYLNSNISSIKNIILWSLCDGATSSLVFSAKNNTLAALILCNPYLHSEEGMAKAILKYYYIKRLTDIEFWKKIFLLKFNLRESFSSFLKLLGKSKNEAKDSEPALDRGNPSSDDIEIPVEWVDEAIDHLKIPVRFFLSTDDLTAKQFEQFLGQKDLKKRKNYSIQYIKDSDHTFSNNLSKQKMFEATLKTIREFSISTNDN